MPTRAALFEGRVYVDEKVPMDPHNRAFRYGDGVFETMLAVEGKLVSRNHHLSRMHHGLQVLGIEGSREYWTDAVANSATRLWETLERPAFARFRFQAFRDGAGTYRPTTNTGAYLAEMSALPSDPWVDNPPVTIGIYHEIPLHHGPLSGIKTLNALPYILAARHAQAQGWDDALLRNTQGHVVEATASNLLLFHEDTLITPPHDEGGVQGIMRTHVWMTASGLNIPKQQRPISPDLLSSAQMIFLTNAIRGIVPVKRIIGLTYTPQNIPLLDALQQAALAKRGTA